MTHNQLRHLDLSKEAIRRRREAGRLRCVYVGVYAVGHHSITDWGRLLAAVMACGPDAVLSHLHAASLWQLPPEWIAVDLAAINVTVAPSSGRGRRAGIVVHRAALDPVDRVVHEGIPVAGVERTLIDLAAGMSTGELERAIDQALTDTRTTMGKLRTALARSAGVRGVAALRALLDAAERFDSLTESALEEAFLRLVREAGIPRPAVNSRVEGMRVDAVWRTERVGVELDGYRWHRMRSRQEADRDRETRLRGAGWTPLRYSARQVFDQPLVVAADVAGALARRRTYSAGGGAAR